MTKRVRVRYAPSPTGHLHIGNARTALFNYLFAKHHNGDFILRIEDTDVERNVEGGEASQLKYLEWLGLFPDESPQKPNEKYAPYRQMERLDIYKKYSDQLLESGHAYKCYCTPEELEADYERQKAEGIASTRYNRKCLHLTETEKEENEAAGKPYTIRLQVPENKTYTFNDLIRGEVSFESKDIGDWVIVKQNGIPTYNFAVVVDDHLMDISHVFRGEEHLSNTPRQIMVYQMLGWEEPEFAHMTLIVNEEGKKLSKRDNTIMQFMSQYEEAGYLSEAMFNFMVLLGWSPKEEREIYTKEELIEIFDETRLSKSPSMFDKNKLAWVNNQYIKKLDTEEYIGLVRPFLEEKYDLSQYSEEWVETLVLIYQDQLHYGEEIIKLTENFFESEFIIEEGAEKILEDESTNKVAEEFLNQIKVMDDWSIENISQAIKAVQKETEIKGRPLFMGLRVAITGMQHGPDLSSAIYLIGKEEVIRRIS